jgi:type VI protein secretion system component VasF
MDIDRKPAQAGRDPAAAGEARRRQRVKNWALAGLLLFLAVLFYFITIVRFGNHG